VKKNFHVVLTSCCLVFLFTGVATSAKADVCGAIAGNVVANCGFETGDFSGWTLSGNLDPRFYGVDSTDPHSGTYAAYLGALGGGGTAIGSLGPFLELSQTLNLLPAEYYRVSFYFDQTAPPTQGYLNYIDLRFGGVLEGFAVNVPVIRYTPVSFVLSTSGDGAAAAQTILQFNIQNDAGFFDLDDVSVVALGPVPEPGTIGLMLAAICGAGVFAHIFNRSRSWLGMTVNASQRREG